MENISEAAVKTVGGRLHFWWRRKRSICGSFLSSTIRMVNTHHSEVAEGVCSDDFKLEVFQICGETVG